MAESNAIFGRIAARLPGQGQSPAKSGGDAFDWFGSFTYDFTKSGIESIPELVGITPSVETQQWRAQNPLAGFLSEFAGTAVPYAGWFGVTKKVKTIDKALQKIGDINKTPVLTGALREAARFTPFEAGRLAASQFVGDRDFGSMFGESAVNLALAGGVGGLIEGVAAAGARNVPLAKLAPGIDIAAPLQLQQRFLDDLLKSGTVLPENASQITYRLKRLRDFSRAETLSEGTPYIGDPEASGINKNTWDSIGRLFRKGKAGSAFVRKRFVQSKGDFAKQGDWENYATTAGLPDNFADLGQYFRAVSFRGKGAPQTSGVYGRAIEKGLDNIGNGWFMQREANNGLFIMARKAKGAVGKFTPEDEYVVFKTDQPGAFVPQQKKWADAIVAQNAWIPQAKVAEDGGDIYNTLSGGIKKFPLHNYAVLPNSREAVKNWIEKLLPPKVGRRGNELVERTKEALLEYLAPAGRQFMKSPRANFIHTNARMAYDAAETMAQKLTYGTVKLGENRSLFYSMLRGRQGSLESEHSVKTVIDALSDQQVKELWQVWRNGAQGDALSLMRKNGEISQGAYDAAVRLASVDDQVWTSLNKTQKATGNPQTKRRTGHYGLSRVWQGDSRIVLRDEGGKPVGIAAGFNRKGAQAQAKELQGTLQNEGISAHIAEEFQISQLAEIPKDLKPVINRPGFVLEQQGMRGFRWDNEPFTKDELLEGLAGGIHSRLKYQANLSVDDLMAEHLAKLGVEDPHAYRLVVARLNDLAGVQGPLGQIQNQIADKILAPVLGSNSASRIVGVTNSAMWTLQLGAMKLAYPIQGALTFMQTVVPEVAFITSAPEAKLAGTYTYFAAGGTKGPVGVVGALHPLKMMARGLRDLRSPSRPLMAAYERAMNDRVIDPRFVEEYVGESAAKLTNMRTALKSGGDFVQWLKALNEFLPGLSERFQRGHAFAVGYDLAKSFLRVSDEEQVYSFARQFTEKTMYLYSVSDRPRMFTTPAGSFLGLFKNWMMNYMAQMLEYTGEAGRGNLSPLMWQTAGTFAVGGLAATPLYLVADGFSNAFAGQGVLQTVYEGMRDNTSAADGLMYGLPAGLTGISMYSQTATPASNPVRDANMLFSTVHLDRMQQLGRAMGTAWDAWAATGEHPGANKKFLGQLARTLAPVTLYRTMSLAQDNMVTSLASGYPVGKVEGFWDRFFYAAGFNPVELDKAYAVSDILFTEENARRAEVSRLGQAFAEAQMEGDNNKMLAVLRRTYVSGIDPSSVLQSAQARVTKMQTPMLERNFKAQDLSRFSKVLNSNANPGD